ncbi:putative glycoside hydrolase [Nitrosococcus oceani]|uniref:putative glycoside hydrolase n=1 Tax=Nitrosococcus oceani TaxID=1229 RepID=UPI000AEC132A|nr:putative glycoside hydrolase [Nitrosococcus oceani]
MIRVLSQYSFNPVVTLILITALFLSACAERGQLAQAPGNTPFWFEPRANQQLDEQVAKFLAEEAAVVVLRASLQGPIDHYDLPALVNRLRQAESSLPVLLYTWNSRYLAKGNRSGKEIMRWLAQESALQMTSLKGTPMPSFGDVMNPDYRRRTVEAIVKALEQSGADGVAVDLAVRTPRFRPKPLAERCAAHPEFCGQYAQGMDALFARLDEALGERPLLYNGLWNLDRGMLDDQVELLKHADAAIVEYFGMNPREKGHSFSQDILPYLKVMQHLKAEKQLFVFGRGPWAYTDYQEDYLWQRYLYCAFLLAKQNNTLFKYHASFQVPTHVGRSGGLDVYADWRLDLGEPEGAYQLKKGLYTRKFEKGMVVVAPDDGEGGTLTLDASFYTPEGKRVQRAINLSPGEGQILFKQRLNRKSASHGIDAQSADSPLSHWQGAQLIQDEEKVPYVRLSNVTKALEGEHDLLLNPVRSLRMPATLNLKVRLREAGARVLLVAEVDDPKRRTPWVVIELAPPKKVRLKEKGNPVLFRTPPPRNAHSWPYLSGPPLTPGQWQELKIEGNKLPSQFRFQRWSHIRFVGDVDVMSVSVSK